METTIQKNFLNAFESGGVVSRCIDYIRQKYDLGYLPQTDNELPPQLAKYNSELHDQIFEDTEAFDDSVIMQTDSPLINEIEQNIKECSTPKEQDRYLFSLLKPFKEFSDIFYPISKIGYYLDTKIQNSKGAVSKKNKCFLFDYEKQKERILYINERFCEINRGYSEQHNTVEGCLNMFVEVVFAFANRLDALLLTYGIDLMRLQKESGIYLKEYRLKPIISKYIGSMELAQKYIDELPKTDGTAIEKTTDNQTTPKELQTEDKPSINIKKLKSYFNAQFKGMGNNENYFENNLIPDLEVKLSNRQIATIALIIYESKKMINKPNSFDSWYTEFCSIMGTERKKYKPSSLTPQPMRNKFYYL